MAIANEKDGETQIKTHLWIKRTELIWALSQQDYNDVEIGFIFNISKQRARIIRLQMPEEWKTPWVKKCKKI